MQHPGEGVSWRQTSQRIGLLDGSAIVLCFIASLYGVSQYLDARSAHVTAGALVLGLMFFGACAGVISVHSVRARAAPRGSVPISRVFLLTLVMVAALYVVSYFRYLPLGQTTGTLVGALSGVYLFTRFRVSFSPHAMSFLAAVFLGASVFFLLRDVCFETLTMGSATLTPRIRQGEKVWINKLAFGLRTPFWSRYLISWDRPATGELVAFLLDDGRLFVKEVLSVDGDLTEVKDLGVVQRSRLRGKVVASSG